MEIVIYALRASDGNWALRSASSLMLSSPLPAHSAVAASRSVAEALACADCDDDAETFRKWVEMGAVSGLGGGDAGPRDRWEANGL